MVCPDERFGRSRVGAVMEGVRIVNIITQYLLPLKFMLFTLWPHCMKLPSENRCFFFKGSLAEKNLKLLNGSVWREADL